MEKGETSPSLKVYLFGEATKLCVLATLKEYIKRLNICPGKDNNPLLSFVKPHNSVFRSTISGWIKNVLREAGTGTENFKGHSTHSASTSKAGLGRLSVTDILERGSCSNASTWQRFYSRSVGTKI